MDFLSWSFLLVFISSVFLFVCGAEVLFHQIEEEKEKRLVFYPISIALAFFFSNFILNFNTVILQIGILELILAFIIFSIFLFAGTLFIVVSLASFLAKLTKPETEPEFREEYFAPPVDFSPAQNPQHIDEAIERLIKNQ